MNLEIQFRLWRVSLGIYILKSLGNIKRLLIKGTVEHQNQLLYLSMNFFKQQEMFIVLLDDSMKFLIKIYLMVFKVIKIKNF